MALTLLGRNRLDQILRNNGFHSEQAVAGDWVAADATYGSGRCFLGYDSGRTDELIVATSLPHVAQAFAGETSSLGSVAALPDGAVAAFAVGLSQAPQVVRRLCELSRALPTAPLDRYHQKVGALPIATEAERLVVQRIGQNVFRDALMDLWAGRCALTGLAQPELLRASHMKPWAACATDAERLDPYNGLLLAAHWDAAFDRGLVTFDDDGLPVAAAELRPDARALLGLDDADQGLRLALRPEHRHYLAWHRVQIWLG